MAALVLSLTGSLVVGGAVWLIVGSRIKFAKDSTQNDILNFLVCFVAALIVVTPLVIFLLG